MASTTFLIGAYGYTAKLIAAKMAEANLSFIAVGRDQSKLEQVLQGFANCVGIIVADCQDAADLGFVAEGAIVVNCAGPFNLFAPQLISKCIEVGAHYLDITGEQEIVRQSYEHYAALAIQKQVCIVHSMAFESALSDLLLSRALQQINPSEIEEVLSYYQLGSQQMSPGTKLTMKLANYAPNYIVEDQCLSPFVHQAAHVPAGLPFEAARIVPYPEVIFAYERLKPKRAASHFVVEQGSNLAFTGNLAQAAPKQKTPIDSIIDRFKKVVHVGPDTNARAGQTFDLYLLVRTTHKDHMESIAGSNMYELSAALVVLALQRFGLSTLHLGVQSPGQFLGQSGLRWLANNPYFQFKNHQPIK